MEKSNASPTLRSFRVNYLPLLQAIYPEREADRILDEWFAHVLAKPRYALATMRTEPLEASVAEEIEAGLQRLAEGEPLQYVRGWESFCGLRLTVNPSVFIPRPETEELVTHAAEAIAGIVAPVVLDACTGSGCIALAIKQLRPDALVSAFDISPEAVATACHNARENGLDIHLFKADLADYGRLPFAVASLYLIVSNPPYVPLDELPSLAPYVRDHEPHLALFAPQGQPLYFFDLLYRTAQHYLKPGGVLLAEGHIDYMDRALALAQQLGDWAQCHILCDASDRPRFIFVRKNG